MLDIVTPDPAPAPPRRPRVTGLTWLAGYAAATITPPADTRLGPTPLARPTAASVMYPCRARALSLAAGPPAWTLLVLDAAGLAAEVALAVTAQARVGPLMVVATASPTAPYLAAGAVPEAYLQGTIQTAAWTARLAADRRAPATLAVGSAPVEYGPLPLVDELRPRWTSLDVVQIRAASGATIARVGFGPPPPWDRGGGDIVASDTLAVAGSRLERLLGTPWLFCPACAAERREVGADSAAEQARDENRLIAAALAADSYAGTPLLPCLDVHRAHAHVRTAPLPNRPDVAAAAERAESAAEFGARVGREDASERGAWLRRLEQATCEGRTAALELPLQTVTLGELTILGLGAEPLPETALRLAAGCDAELLALVAGANGRLAPLTPRPGHVALATGVGLEPLTDLWPLAAGAGATILDALAKD